MVSVIGRCRKLGLHILEVLLLANGMMCQCEADFGKSTLKLTAILAQHKKTVGHIVERQDVQDMGIYNLFECTLCCSSY